MTTTPLNHLAVVLYRTRTVANIGGVVRAMKNMGVQHLRLVEPAAFDPAAVLSMAHRSDDVLAATTLFPTLDAALADTVFVVGTTARTRGEHALVADLRGFAPEVMARAHSGTVALLFGPEDKGLDNAALDRCHAVVRLATDPAYSSLNLAQAVLLLLYELRMAALDAPPAEPPAEPPAAGAQLATLFDAAEAALERIAFFKGGNAPTVMRTLRQVLLRARPTAREVALLTAIAREVPAFLRRQRPG